MTPTTNNAILQIDIRKNITKNERDVVDMVIDYKIIGKRIKAERAKHKFTQEEMAEKLNTSVAFYSRIETGRSHVNLTRNNGNSQYIKCLSRIFFNRNRRRWKQLFV